MPGVSLHEMSQSWHVEGRSVFYSVVFFIFHSNIKQISHSSTQNVGFEMKKERHLDQI